VFDAKKAMTLCADCYHLGCMDCMKNDEGKMVCKPCASKAKWKRNLKRAVVWPYKGIAFLWGVKIEF
jgi:hypothetical protein